MHHTLTSPSSSLSLLSLSLLNIRLHIPALCSPSALVVTLDTLDTLSATSQRALVPVVVILRFPG